MQVFQSKKIRFFIFYAIWFLPPLIYYLLGYESRQYVMYNTIIAGLIVRWIIGYASVFFMLKYDKFTKIVRYIILLVILSWMIYQLFVTIKVLFMFNSFDRSEYTFGNYHLGADSWASFLFFIENLEAMEAISDNAMALVLILTRIFQLVLTGLLFNWLLCSSKFGPFISSLILTAISGFFIFQIESLIVGDALFTGFQMLLIRPITTTLYALVILIAARKRRWN